MSTEDIPDCFCDEHVQQAILKEINKSVKERDENAAKWLYQNATVSSAVRASDGTERGAFDSCAVSPHAWSKREILWRWAILGLAWGWGLAWTLGLAWFLLGGK